jgi:hypothetical protein
MAKSSLEKTIEKQMKERKRLAEKEERSRAAASIVNGQPMVGGMRIMDSASEEILGLILAGYDGNERFEVHSSNVAIPVQYERTLPAEFERLKQYGMVSDYCVYISAMWDLTLTPMGQSYFDDKEKALEADKQEKAASINIGSIIANGSNLVLGDVLNSALSVDNSMQRIEKEIEEKGGDEAEELRQLLEEVKEYIENMQESKHVAKNKGLFAKLSNHLEKHGWFYGEVVGLLGTAVLQLVQG